LKACASKDVASIASNAAAQAVRWMTRQIPVTPQLKESSVREQAILTMFRFGIPRTDQSNIFFEEAHNLKWYYQAGAWRYQKVVSDVAVKEAPNIAFDVYISSDHSKALIAAGMTFGPLNGKGYTYLLKKEKGEWKVIGILSTWIS
jgi:hypothetical protein